MRTVARLALSASLLLFSCVAPQPVLRAQGYLPKLGGPGGGSFDAPCRPDQNLTGFELRTGDDVDAIRPVCVTAFSAGNASAPIINVPWGDPSWHGGGGGGQMHPLLCPLHHPVVLGMSIGYEGVANIVVNSIALYCGQFVATAQNYPTLPNAIFEGPTAVSHSNGPFIGDGPNQPGSDSEQCPAGQVAVGLHGRSGVWLDAMGLICDVPRMPTLAPGTVGSMGRVSVPGPAAPPVPPHTICDSARSARARNSPAAPDLEAQCRASQAPTVPPIVRSSTSATAGTMRTSVGRTPVPAPDTATPIYEPPVCAAARDAVNSRNQSPQAQDLIKRCQSLGGNPHKPAPSPWGRP